MLSHACATSCRSSTLRMRMAGDIDRRPVLAPRRFCSAQRWASARVVTGSLLTVTTRCDRTGPCQALCCTKWWSEVTSGSRARPSIGATGLEPIPSGALLNRTRIARPRPDRGAPADPRHRIIQTCARHTPWTLGQWSPRELCPQARRAAPVARATPASSKQLAQTGVVSRCLLQPCVAKATQAARNTYRMVWHRAAP